MSDLTKLSNEELVASFQLAHPNKIPEIRAELLRRLNKPTVTGGVGELLERYDYLFDRLYDECVPDGDPHEKDADKYADEADKVMRKLRLAIAELQAENAELAKDRERFYAMRKYGWRLEDFDNYRAVYDRDGNEIARGDSFDTAMDAAMKEANNE